MKQDQKPIEEEQVRDKAHELWQERGCPEGTPDEDWYRAEQLLRDEALADTEPPGEVSAAGVATDAGRSKKRRAGGR
jgi:hypothetical protein